MRIICGRLQTIHGDDGMPITVEMNSSDEIRLSVPASEGQTVVRLSVDRGRLVITGGASIIAKIVGPGMAKKIQPED